MHVCNTTGPVRNGLCFLHEMPKSQCSWLKQAKWLEACTHTGPVCNTCTCKCNHVGLVNGGLYTDRVLPVFAMPQAFRYSRLSSTAASSLARSHYPSWSTIQPRYSWAVLWSRSSRTGLPTGQTHLERRSPPLPQVKRCRQF